MHHYHVLVLPILRATSLGMTSEISCFKAYDVRGRIPSELNQEIAFKIGAGVASHFSTKSVVVGYDVRPSSLDILDALARGIASHDSEVISIP